MGDLLRLPLRAAAATRHRRAAHRARRTTDHDGLDYGGEVIVPNFSFIASATAPLDRRFGVAFVDVDPGTLAARPGAGGGSDRPG